MLSNDRFLFISAHPDDTELSAGGLVHFLARHGKTVKILILSNPSISLPSGYTNNTLIDEQTAAAAELKIASENLIFMIFPVRRFSETRQDILEELVALRDDYNPQFVFTSHPNDTHQDHSQIGQEARRAFTKTNLLYFEAPGMVHAFSVTIPCRLKSKISTPRFDPSLALGPNNIGSTLPKTSCAASPGCVAL